MLYVHVASRGSPVQASLEPELGVAASYSAIVTIPETEHQSVLQRGHPQHKYGPVDGTTLATYVHRVQSPFGLVCGLCNLTEVYG